MTQSFTVSASGAGFPQTSVLDNFNRPNGRLGSNWSGATATSQYVLKNDQVEPDGSLPIYWNPSPYGVNQEAFVTLSKVDPNGQEQDLMLKVQGGPNGIDYSKGVIEVDYLAQSHAVRLSTLRPNSGWFDYPTVSATFQAGDQFGARAYSTGEVRIYRNRQQIASIMMKSADRAFFDGRGGYIGLWFVSSRGSVFDDFGGGTFAP